MLHIGSVKENQRCTSKKIEYMKRIDAEIARRRVLKTLHALAGLAVIAYLVFAPAGLQVHHNLHQVLHVIGW